MATYQPRIPAATVQSCQQVHWHDSCHKSKALFKVHDVHLVMCMSKCCCLYLNSCGVYTSLHMLALTFPCTYKNTCHFVRTLLILHKLGFLCSFLEEYISKIRKYLDENCTRTLVQAFVSSKLDYCNALLIGLPKYQIDRVQSVLNTAARIITFTC